jgi:hypothetical protein
MFLENNVSTEIMEINTNQGFDDSVNRRNDPNYAQVSGYINKDLAMQFKITCTATEVSQTDALEEAVALWLEKQNKTGSKPKQESKVAKR